MNSYYNRIGKFILPLFVICMISTVATAQNSSDKDNKIVLTPYLWGTSISGTSTIGMLPPLDIDASFSDLFSNLNFAASVHTEFWVGDWIFVIDPTYLSLEMDIGLPPPLPQDSSLAMDVDIWLVEAWIGYRFTENWEAIGGARYQSQDISVNGLPNPPFPDNIGISENWTDWFLGARFRTDLGEKWFMIWRGDVVVAGDSDTSWNASVFFNRRVGKKGNKALNLGYRYFVNDYNNTGSYRWDVTQDGPVVGFTWVF